MATGVKVVTGDTATADEAFRAFMAAAFESTTAVTAAVQDLVLAAFEA